MVFAFFSALFYFLFYIYSVVFMIYAAFFAVKFLIKLIKGIFDTLNNWNHLLFEDLWKKAAKAGEKTRAAGLTKP